MRVWIDQDLCTGDGLCTDHCPDVFALLEDGISYVHRPGAGPDGGGLAAAVAVARRHEAAVVLAAVDCPGECIFVEPEGATDAQADDDIVDAVLVLEDGTTSAQ